MNKRWLTFWCAIVLKFEELIVQYLKICHFIWDSAYILCSMKIPLFVHVFSPTCNEQSKNQNNVVSVPCLLISSWPCTEHRVLKIGAASCWKLWSIETWWWLMITVLSIVTLCQVVQILKCRPRRFDHSKENLKSHTSLSYSKRCLYVLLVDTILGQWWDPLI